MIEKNETWKLVDKHETKQVILVKWVKRLKLNEDALLFVFYKIRNFLSF